MEKEKKYTIINNIFICIFTILFFYLSLKKCGFYKTDILIFSLGLEIIGVAYIVYNYITNKVKRKFDVIGVLLLGLSVAYILPIIFSNFTSLNDAICEYIRYFNLYLVYKIVALSNDKKIFKNILIYISIFLGIFGIDGMGVRFFNDFFSKINSGYLNTDFDRMSSLVQYANTFAIILFISSIFVFEELIKSIKEKSNKNIIKYNTLLVFFISCIILSQSRSVIFLLIISVIMYYLYNIKKCKKENMILVFLLSFLFVESMIYSSFVLKGINIDKRIIYYLTILLIITNIFGNYIILKFLKKIENSDSKYIFFKKYIKYISIFVIIFFAIYLAVGAIIPSSLTISEDSTQTVRRFVYNVEKNGKNKLDFTVKSLDEDSRYKVEIYGISKKNEKVFFKEFEYYDTISGNFNYEVQTLNNLKCLELDFTCYKGKIKVLNSHINNQNMVLEYLLIPTEIINKVKDMLTFTDSLSLRMIYLKDAFRIWNLSFKNKLIGIGGEGFKNTYQLIQNQNYTSTEVHNSFMQILLESGIIGLICIVSVICIFFVKSQKNVYKYAMVILIIHSLIDLDFSYMIILCIFGILLGVNSQSFIVKEYSIKEKVKIFNFFKYLKYVEYSLFIFLSIFSVIVVFKMNVAYYMNIPEYEEKELDLKKAEYLIKLNQKRVSLDSSENRYRKELAVSYQNYLEKFENYSENISKEQKEKNIILILNENEENAIKMKANNKKDKENLINISDIYFWNLKYILSLEYSTYKEERCKEYIQEIMEDIKFIKENYEYNENAKKMLGDRYNKYLNEIIKNENDSIYLDDFINYLKYEKSEMNLVT